MQHSKRIIPLLILVILLVAANVRAQEQTSIVLQWLPQAQFAGFYMAEDKGLYKEAGLEVEIYHGGPDILASEYLESGKADFATMFLSTGLMKRASLPIVNVGQFVQHSALMLVTLKSSNINSLDDLGGKKIGLWANEFQVQGRALFKRKGINVNIIPQSDSLDLFMRGGVQAASAMWYNEYHTLLNYGLEEDELRPFFYRDFDLDFPEDGIYCLESTADSKPEVVKALVEATARGWMYAFNHPDEAIESVMRRMTEARVPANRAHQRWMLARMENIIYGDDTKSMGILKQAEYERVKDTLIEMDFIDKAPLFPEFYRGPVR
ncbi:ABC transporter substrate-binding protein [Pseudodesulfovibrio sp. zrk46]|uniref:ABC transporter substrate-binding protein n=1 Tax=Pseudodesulfovibrio sp. zrk46 TaxID=2725288 RepID=UPI001FFD9232|nr:ABC transporter substrate-binding protein [Pseudodesulfovibrio sp. zrk46]